MNRLALALGLALLAVEIAAGAALLATNGQDDVTWTLIVLQIVAGSAFVISGLIALARRPENRTGVYLAATGYVWFLGALTGLANEWLFAVGFIVGDLVWITFTALVLAYPTGRFETRLERALPLAVGVLIVVTAVTKLLFDPTPAPDRCDSCPGSPIVIAERPGLGNALDVLTSVAGLALIGIVVVILTRRWRRATPAARRALWPVVGAGVATLVSVALVITADRVSETAARGFQLLLLATFSAVPFAFLFGILRTRLARSSVSELVVSLEEGTPLQGALAKALGDPTIELAYRPAGMDRWVDAEGHAVPEPAPLEGRAQTTIEHAGLPIAVLDYDVQLADQRELVDAVAAAASLRIQNERLYAGVRAQYAFLETMTDTAPSLLVHVDTDGRILNQNRAAVAVAGVGDQELVRGQYFWDVFISPSERGDVIARFRALAPDFAPAEYENTFTNQLGEERVIYWRSAPVHDDGGTTVSIIAGGLDITERVRIAEEKEREREFLNAIANNAPSLICLIDDEGRVTERGVNVAFERTLEWRDRDVGGCVFWEHWVDEEEAAEVEARIRRVIAGETLGEHDSLWITSTGRRLSIAWTCTPLPELDERKLFLMSGVDVTERKRREEEIRAGEERFRAVIESAPVAITEIGRDDTVKLWNRAAEAIFGWSADEVLGHPPRWVPEELRGEFQALSDLEAAGEGYTGFETTRLHRDGRRLKVEIAAAPIRDADGAVIGAMAVLSDITDRKRQEEELRASRARLVAAGDEARQRLERDLHDGAQQRLVALSVSLRLAEAKLSEDPVAATSILAGAREELALALNELRELARGIHPAVLTDRGLAPAVATLVARAPLPVEVEVEDTRLPAAVEAASYYVVAEALTNVAKYASASTAHVHVTQKDGRLVIEVADDGAGGADPARGSGLRGLADRVAALDGTLVVESPLGKGTWVRAEIPLSSPATPE